MRACGGGGVVLFCLFVVVGGGFVVVWCVFFVVVAVVAFCFGLFPVVLLRVKHPESCLKSPPKGCSVDCFLFRLKTARTSSAN